MSRIQPNPSPDAKSQELLAGVKQLLGGTPNMFTTLAHSSSALGFAVAGFTGFGQSNLGAALREQIALTIAGENGCTYCASAHTTLGKMNAIAEDELSKNLYGQSNDARTQAALTFAQAIVKTRGHVSDDALEAIRAAGFGDADILDIVAVVTFNIFTNYINNVAKTQVDFPRVEIKTPAGIA